MKAADLKPCPGSSAVPTLPGIFALEFKVGCVRKVWGFPRPSCLTVEL